MRHCTGFHAHAHARCAARAFRWSMALKKPWLLAAAIGILLPSARALCTYGTTEGNPGQSCREILVKNPDCFGQSGLYWVQCGWSPPQQLFCEMSRLRGGWIRVAKANFTNGTACPGYWAAYAASNGLDYCAVPADLTGQQKASWYIDPPCSYSEVNGYVLGDQQGNCDGFVGGAYLIYKPYVDGVSFTYGGSDGPGLRSHLFTYAVGREEQARQESCECHGSTAQHPPHYVGVNFMCDSGMKPFTAQASRIGYRVLWTGEGCGAASSCCHRAGAPWFYRKLARTVNRQLEIRIMQTSGHSDEKVLVRELELYIR